MDKERTQRYRDVYLKHTSGGYFNEKGITIVANTARDDTIVALVEEFKTINALFGNDQGDRFLEWLIAHLPEYMQGEVR